MAKIDLGKFKKPQSSYLQSPNKEEKNSDSENNKREEKINNKKKSGKIGRPMTTNQKLDQKITVNVSSPEFEKLKGKIGKIPAATFIRDLLKKEGFI